MQLWCNLYLDREQATGVHWGWSLENMLGIEAKKTGKTAFEQDRWSPEPGWGTWGLFCRHKEATEGPQLIIDILVPCAGAPASWSLQCSPVCCVFSLPSLLPLGSVFRRLSSCVHLFFNEGIVVLPSLWTHIINRSWVVRRTTLACSCCPSLGRGWGERLHYTGIWLTQWDLGRSQRVSISSCQRVGGWWIWAVVGSWEVFAGSRWGSWKKPGYGGEKFW